MLCRMINVGCQLLLSVLAYLMENLFLFQIVEEEHQ